MVSANDKTALFETMPVGKVLVTMAVPTIISQLINLIYNLVDTFFIGRTGNAYMIAAASVAYTLFVMNVSFANLFGLGGGSLMARLSGRGENDKAKAVSAFSAYGAIAIGLFYSLIIIIFCNPLLRILGASDETIGFAKQYVYTVLVIGNVPTILSTTLAHLTRNAGYSKQASIGLSLGGILNIALDPLFMFVILPDGMEVFGAGLATLISNIVSSIYLLTVFKKIGKNTQLCLSFQKAKTIKKHEVSELFAVGVPSAILTGLFDIANMFLNANMAFYGEEAVAALGIVMKVERLPNAVNVGICQGMMPVIAYNYSSGNRKRMKEIIKTETICGFIVCLFTISLFELLAKPITSVFLNSNSVSARGALETLSLAVVILRVRCLVSPFQFMNYRSSFCMQAMGDGTGTLIHACMRQLVFYIPFMYILKAFFGFNGLISSLLAGEFCGMITALILMNRKLKKNKSFT